MPLYHTGTEVIVPVGVTLKVMGGSPAHSDVSVGDVVLGGLGDGLTTKLSVTVLADAGAFIQPFTAGIESIILYV